jgi:hypothetical protein
MSTFLFLRILMQGYWFSWLIKTQDALCLSVCVSVGVCVCVHLVSLTKHANVRENSEDIKAKYETGLFP